MSKASDHKYYLNIHHRSIAINIDQETETLEQSSSPGHFYVSLQKNEKRAFFGKYSQGQNLIKQLWGKEVIVTDEEELHTLGLKKLLEQTGKDYHSFKSIILTDEQYENALDYALSKTDGRAEPGNYILAIDDCTDFVQQVYNQAGLPLYFTIAFSRNELLTLGSVAAHKVLTRYGASDCMDLVFGAVKSTSKKALASSLNIDIDNIFLNSSDLDLNAPVFSLPSFKLLTDQIKLPKIITVEQKPSTYDTKSYSSQKTTSTESDYSSIINSLPLSKDQKQQAASDMQDFFTGMMQNPYVFDPKAFIPSQKDLFAEEDRETQEWVNNIVGNTEDILNNMGFNKAPNQSQNQNSYEQTYDSMFNSIGLLGQVFNGININKDDSLD